MFRNLLLSLGSLGIFFLGVESYFRFFHEQEFQINHPYEQTQIRGVVHFQEPFWHYQEIYPLNQDPRNYYAASKGVIPYYFDQFGGRWVRAEERKLKKKVALALGDSLTYGFGLRYEDSFLYLLSLRIPLDFVNLARPAADAADSLRIYEKVSNKIPHDALVFGLHLNDLIEFPTSYVSDNALLNRRFFLVSHSRALRFFLTKWDVVLGRPQRIQNIKEGASPQIPFYAHNLEALKQMQAMAAKKKIPFRVIILPFLVDVQEKTFSETFARVKQSLAEAGIKYLDLSQGWDAFHDQELWITPFDQHPNEVANKLFAERLSDEFRQQKLF